MMHRQTWRTLLFAHWPVPVESVRSLVPARLEVETLDGTAWVGLVPFRLTGLRPGWPPRLPGLSFLEMNLRTYVRPGGGIPGVFFFSLDASSRLAVAAARRLYRLPYHHASMRMRERDGWIDYESRRREAGWESRLRVEAEARFPQRPAPREPTRALVGSGSGDSFPGADDSSTRAEPAVARLRYRSAGPAFRARPGSAEAFLTERYALYTDAGGGRLLRTRIAHDLWPLRRAEAVIERNTIAAAVGVPLSGEPPLLWYSDRQETRIGRREEL